LRIAVPVVQVEHVEMEKENPNRMKNNNKYPVLISHK